MITRASKYPIEARVLTVMILSDAASTTYDAQQTVTVATSFGTNSVFIICVNNDVNNKKRIKLLIYDKNIREAFITFKKNIQYLPNDQHYTNFKLAQRVNQTK